MLTYEDCVGLSELTEDEIHAIAQHDHLTELAALELGAYLVKTEDGRLAIKKMILDDIERALGAGSEAEALKLKATLKHYVDTHPENPNRADSDA
jgi:hypothetical protein